VSKCACYSEGYEEGYENGRDDGYLDGAHDFKIGHMCGVCEYWYQDRNACFYYPRAARLDSCDKWKCGERGGIIWAPIP
jgi:hypothetical protein